MNTFYLGVGVSATGKSTRVYQLLQFLKTKFRNEPHSYSGKIDGILFPDQNLLFLGLETSYNGLKKWQGCDSLTKLYGGSDGLSAVFEKYVSLHTVITDGSALFASHRFRPEFLYTNSSIRSLRLFTYIYKTFDQYRERVAGRSSYEISEDAPSWRHNGQFAKAADRFTAEMAKMGNPKDCDYQAIMLEHSTPVTYVGEVVLKEQLPELLDEFLKWSSETNYAKKFTLKPSGGFF
jgi:hypothetical protein